MKLWIMAALIALIAVSSYPREAKALSGKELLEYCEAEDLNPTCVNYIKGSSGDTAIVSGFSGTGGMTMDSQTLGGLTFSEKSKAFDSLMTPGGGVLGSMSLFCLPEGITMQASTLYLQNVLIDYLRAHPDDLHLGAAELTETAFIEAFPCTSGR